MSADTELSRIPRRRAPGDAPGYAALRTPLPPGLPEALTRTAEELNTSVADLVLAAYVHVHAAITSDRDVLVGCVRSTAHRAPLTLRHTVTGSSWADLVTAVSHTPLAHRPGVRPEATVDLTGLTRPAAIPGESPAGDGVVLHTGWERDEHGGLTLRLHHDTAHIDAAYAERLAGYQLTALRLLTADPAARHDRQSLLSPQERRTQIFGLAGPRAELPDATFTDLFEEQARRTPDAPAALHGELSWTYRRLDERAGRVARALAEAGAGAEDTVAVVMERSLDWIASAVGVFKAGAVYLPMPPDLPVERMAYQLRAAGAVVVLTDHDSEAYARKALAELDSPPPVLNAPHLQDTDGPAPPTPTGPAPQASPAPDRAAYVFFTSGSTGTPKGAVCEHAGMLNHLLAKVEDMGLAAGAGEVVAQTASQGFDISLWQFAAPLLTGAAVRVVDSGVLLDPEGFLAEIAGGGVTVAQTVPAHLDALLRGVEHGTAATGALHTVCVTGDVLAPALVRRWFAAFPGVRLVNAYGATEVCDDTTHHVMDAPPDGGTVPLGRPLRNVNTYVLDENLEPVPLGSVGEIAFSGVCVGRGYLNDEARTPQSFVPDPFRAGTRMYRTGDFGRWLPGGRLEYLGRHDEQVKIRGFRIELGEIEHRLRAVPGVREAAVVVDGEAREPRNLAAFFTAWDAPSSPDLVAAAREFLGELLPHYMVPAHLYRLDRLPLTTHGKVDKAALGALAGTLGHGGAAHTAPAGPGERRLAMAWAEVLGAPLERIGRDDNFFALGGTSLAAVRLIAQLDRRLTVRELVAHPRLADLAGVLAGRGRGETGPGGQRLLHPLLPVRSVHHTLVCFPYAGGNAVNFRSLAAQLEPEGIAVLGAELPGHDFAAEDEPLLDVPTIAARARDEILAHVGTPVLLWGHCAGSAVALATARLLQEAGRPVRRVFLGAQLLLPDEELRAEAERVAGVDRRLLLDRMRVDNAYVELDAYRPERARIADRSYRHDVGVANRHLVRARQDPRRHRVSAPVDVVVARDDTATADAGRRHRAWLELCDEVTLHELDQGGHYFVGTRPALTAALVRAACAPPGDRGDHGDRDEGTGP
ncbi:amino acid adenylation domain-containing protein [Streptomyces sp. NPDC006645]|uniref:non-ribosomal peptide synthetase n=1 Tax=unclassified Streptomyces TaxID=2593676 RepID=UPI0033A97944